jgi:uncharacterized phage infection (PIP) family protein YhgE
MMLSKRDFTFSVVSSSAMAHAMALVKSHMPNFDAEILPWDFPINDEERDALVDSVYDTAQYFASSMISLYSLSQITMLLLMLEPCTILSAASCNKLILIYKFV